MNCHIEDWLSWAPVEAAGICEGCGTCLRSESVEGLFGQWKNHYSNWSYENGEWVDVSLR